MKQFTSFRLGRHLFGLEVLLVREINQQMDITPVQHAPEHVRGLINLRGQIVTIFDLGIRLGLAERKISQHSHSIVLKTNDELNVVQKREGRSDLTTNEDTIGLLVDEIGDVVEVNDSEIDPPPANVGEIDGRFLSGVVKLERELMVVLDVSEVLAAE